jgi:hypothetical protein
MPISFYSTFNIFLSILQALQAINRILHSLKENKKSWHKNLYECNEYKYYANSILIIFINKTWNKFVTKN